MSAVGAPSEGTAQEVVGEVLPEQFDWERLVRSYPVPALLLAAAGGFVLARARGRAIVAALGAFAADRVTEEVHRVLGEDVLQAE
jgi:hypothetical protein